MKKGKCFTEKKMLFAFIFSLSFILFSCNEFYFSDPQPVDRKNITAFPDEFIGKWNSGEGSTNPVDQSGSLINPGQHGPSYHEHASNGTIFNTARQKEDSSFVIINKNNIQLHFYASEKIVKGAWPKLLNGAFIYAGDNDYNSLQSISYDSLKQPIDITDNYLLRDNRIYEYNDKGELEKGYTYEYDGDTIQVFKRDTLIIDLGLNAFLRRLNELFYVLNIRSQVIGENNSWWQFFILEKTAANSLKEWECSTKTKTLPSMIYPANSKAELYYFNSKWTAADIMQLMKEGYIINTEEYFRKK